MRNRTLRRLLLPWLVAGALSVFWQAPPAPSRGENSPRRNQGDFPALVGTASCTAAACHGGPSSEGIKGSEYSRWSARDKHVQAYTVLLSPRSQVILRNLKGSAPDAKAHPEKELTCLRCHSTNADLAERGDIAACSDGVGCESCHGAAGQWIARHYARDWKELSATEKTNLGFVNTKDLVSRAEQCSKCHIGVPGQEVDHDLLAAGHPRVSFEFASYMVGMSPHWSLRAEKARIPDLEERSWVIGQAVSAQRALELLAHRAEHKKDAWPEFAEYECYACHHGFREPSPWQHDRGKSTIPGSLRWSTWYSALLPHALETRAGATELKEIEDRLAALAKEMNRPYPDPTEVKARAQAAAKLLERSLPLLKKTDTYPPASPSQVFHRIAADRAHHLDASWDSAAQCYLALAAMYRAMGDAGSVRRGASQPPALRKLGEQLLFPPVQAERPATDSPRDFDPAGFGRERTKLQDVPH